VEGEVWEVVSPFTGRVWAGCCVPPQIFFNLWFKLGHFCSNKFGVQAKGWGRHQVHVCRDSVYILH